MWKTGQVGNTQRAVCNAAGEVRAVAENTMTASVIVRALNEYEQRKEHKEKLGELRDAVSRALLLLSGDELDDGHRAEAIEILRQASDSASGQGEAAPVRMVRVSIVGTGLGGMLTPTHTILTTPGNGVTHAVPPYQIGVRVDPA
jgi:hypothetical protein